MRTTFYGIIFSLLFKQLRSSYFFICSDLCGSSDLTIDELDIVVRDPSRYQRQRRDSRDREMLPDDLPRISAPPSPPPPPNPNQNDSEFPELKSILKKSKFVKRKSVGKSVSFSAGIEEKSRPESPNVPISFNDRRYLEDLSSIADEVEYYYELDEDKDKEEEEEEEEKSGIVNELIIEMNLPIEVVNLIKFNYPGFGNVRITVLDLSGLVLFATFLNHPNNYFKTLNLLQFLNEFLSIFPFSLPLIQSIQSDPLKHSKISKLIAFDGIHRAAHKYSLYYTLEAFYKVFGKGHAHVFIRESIKVGDMKMFSRFLQEDPNINPNKLVAWSLKFGNEKIFWDYIERIELLQNVKNQFKIPIILHFADEGFYFHNIVDLLFPLEWEYFDAALSISISKGNHKLFKDLIKFDNSFFESSHDSRVLDVLRSIFYNQLVDLNSIGFLSKEIFMKLLKLNSDDPSVLVAFKSALKESGSQGYSEKLLLESLFLKTRAYSKIILESCPKLNFVVMVGMEVGNVKFCMWELVKDSEFYLDVLESFTKSKSFSVLHAVGDLEFPKSLWPNIIRRCKLPQSASEMEMEYKDFIHIFGFNEDILSQDDLVSLGLDGKRIWSLLELAIINFNLDAVEAILEKFPLDNDQKQSAINLTKASMEIVNSNEYIATHPMTSLAMKQMTLDNYKSRLPDFYFKEVRPVDFLKFVTKLRWNIKCISELLLNKE
jgi:hypothetical protein